jgi:hypothetical protein
MLTKAWCRKPLATLGHYMLIEELGMGGFGVV